MLSSYFNSIRILNFHRNFPAIKFNFNMVCCIAVGGFSRLRLVGFFMNLRNLVAISGNVRDVFIARCFLNGILQYVLCAIFLSFPVDSMAIGGVEEKSSWSYTGWACDPQAPGYQSEVQARRGDGVFLGRIIADRLISDAIVPAHCRSPHGVHGFQFNIKQKPEWMDGKTHDVTFYSVAQNGSSSPFYTYSTVFLAATENVEPPRHPGDIVGRDLDSKILPAAGHIGVWDGEMVIEALDESGQSKIFKNSWDNFKSRTKAWNTAHPRYPAHYIKTCWDIVCDINPGRTGFWVSAQQAVFYRATQVYRIGADYTWGMGITTAEPAMRDYKESSWRRDSIRGLYRCDTFVYDAFRASTDLNLAGIFPYREVNKMHPSWSEKVSSLIGYRTFTPVNVMEKIRRF